MKTFLVVDDEPSVLALICRVITFLGHRACPATDGTTALGILSEGLAVDGVITDVRMPGMGGFELARRVKAENPSLPILFVSGFFEATEVPPDVASLGGIHTMNKPFELKSMAARIADLFP